MSLSEHEISRIANLARLELQPEEQVQMRHKINEFFGIVEQISAVDTSGVVPMAHPLDAMPASALREHLQLSAIELRLRPDVPSEPNQREANQQSAPAVERGLFLVPKVIE